LNSALIRLSLPMKPGQRRHADDQQAQAMKLRPRKAMVQG
jgi:hypothetical protein